MLSLKNSQLLGLIIVLIATPVLAGNKLILARGGENTAVLTGRTNGNFSLTSLSKMSTIPNLQGEKKPCIGYASPTPDHLIELKESLPQLTLKVEAQNSDTSIVIQGPGKDDFRCEFATNNNPDTLFEGQDWKKGEYKVWVGTINQGQATDYRLSIQGGITQQ